MRRALLIWCLLLAGIACIAQSERVSAFWQSRDSNYNKNVVSSGGATTTFDPSNTGTLITLSGGNLTAVMNNASALGNAGMTRSITSHSTSKYYNEFTATTSGSMTAYNIGLGVADSSQTLNGNNSTRLGNTIHGIAFYSINGQVYFNGSLVTTIQGYGIGDVVGQAVDIGAQKIWWRTNGGNWNNDVIANQNPATGAGGISFSGMGATAFAVTDFNDSNPVGTVANFGATSYGTAAPSGFVNW